MQDRNEMSPSDWRRPFWISVLVAASVAFSLAFKCAMPFAAIAAVAACTLPRRDAWGLTAAAWLVNQVLGFAFLDYPRTAETFTWGLVLGLVALVCTVAAQLVGLLLDAKHSVVRDATAFLAAFAVYEALLFIFSLGLGGIENYTWAIQLWVFGLNVLALVGLLALNWAGNWIGVAYARPLTAEY